MAPDPAPPAPDADRRERRRAWQALVLLLAASLLFRVPPLLNAAGLHSDAAVVGLQAMHLLRGEGAWFIWGAGYQSAFDAAVVAAVFAVAGATPLALMAAPLLGHLLLTGLTFDVLRRRTSAAAAAVCTLPLVVAPSAINGVALSPPRQWCLTALFLGVWLVDGAAASRAPRLRAFAGALAGGLSLVLDLYALQLLPAFVALAAASGLEDRPPLRASWPRVRALAAGAALALLALWLSRRSPAADAAKATLTLDRLAFNLDLLWGTCLPWVLGYGVQVPGPNLYPDLWRPPGWFHAVQVVGAASLVVGIAAGGVAALLRVVPWPLRALGAFGALASLAAVGGFLLSPMPSDLWATRYLAPIVWTAPLALAPVAARLRTPALLAALAPYLVASAAGGWMSYGPWVRGPLPVRSPRGAAEDEQALGQALRERGIRHGAAQYWLAYRLTFLWQETPTLVPFEGDRYPPYRQAFAEAPVVAYVFHPSEPRAVPDPLERLLRQAGARYERLEVRGFTVLIHHRRDPGRPS